MANKINYDSILNGEKPKSKFEIYGNKLADLLELSRTNGDNRIHHHQREAVLTTMGMLLEDKGKRIRSSEVANENTVSPVLIVSPTGSGKSGMIVLLPYVLKARRLLVLTPSKVISEQIGRSFGMNHDDKSFFEVTGVFKDKDKLTEILEPVKIISTGSDIKARLTNVVIVNAQKFGGKSSTTLSLLYKKEAIVRDVEKFFAQFDLSSLHNLIVDEAHHYPAETWKNIVTYFSKPVDGLEKKIIFLTATPYRKNKKGELVPVLKDERIAFTISSKDLERKFIRQTLFRENLDHEQVADDIRQLLDEQELSESRFPAQAMVIVKDRKQALSVEKLLNQSFGKKFAVAIFKGHKEINDEERIQRFDSGHHRVAIVCGLLKEGYDNPKVTICVILRKIRSQTLFSQFVGRCMRINRAVEGEVDKTTAVVISYRKYDQKIMWEKREELAEKDPIEVDDDFISPEEVC